MTNPQDTIETLRDFLRDLTTQTDEQRMELLDNLKQAYDGVSEDVVVEFTLCGIYNALREFMDEDLQVKYPVKEPMDFNDQG